MIGNFNEKSENKIGYDSDLLLNILNKSSIEIKNRDDKELFVDENWKINSKDLDNITPSKNANLERILSEIFPEKKILVNNNSDGTQTIFLS
tara:strand:+ start:638 stop:913 length:276 start_codon:yes stop_codon:yes gene_type:complete